MRINVFWFRRDLRLDDNMGLQHALKQQCPTLPIFIFDSNILDDLPSDDPRVSFIHKKLLEIDEVLKKNGSSLLCLNGKPIEVWKMLLKKYDINEVFINKDYEPYSRERDNKVSTLLSKHNIKLHQYKDHVIFEEDEIVKKDGLPYTVFTPYKKKWYNKHHELPVGNSLATNKVNFLKFNSKFPSLSDIDFKVSPIKTLDFRLDNISEYKETRDYPALDSTTYLGPHLRFGTISIRSLVYSLAKKSPNLLDELIWREFFMQILFHFPHVVHTNFKAKYNNVSWRNDELEFDKWKKGQTGYPIVDAGMRQLNKTGYMHNRVRMITASFLCKHLLINWQWGESYFAEKLLDYELSSNNGNWQWAASTGCDAVPYFRIFNPSEQIKKFDKDLKYVKKWVPEHATKDYTTPIVEHKFARERAIATYKKGLGK